MCMANVSDLIPTQLRLGTITAANFLELARDSVPTLDCPRTDASHTQLGSGPEPNAAHFPLYILFCLEHSVVAWLRS